MNQSKYSSKLYKQNLSRLQQIQEKLSVVLVVVVVNIIITVAPNKFIPTRVEAEKN
jgi:hypothetical protein